MKKTARFFAIAFFALAAIPAGSYAQRNCGTGIRNRKLAVENPALFQQMRERQQQRTEEALAFMNNAAYKPAGAQSPIPVVFHFILTPTQYNDIGRDTGIRRRVYSQLKSLNADFNRKNADSSQIPAAFKSLYTNVNIQFSLAKGTNANTISDGIEVKVVSTLPAPVYDVNNECYTAKEATAVGLPSWDVNKYLNIWVVNITAGGTGVVVGVTTPPTSVGTTSGTHTITAAEKGVVLNYGAIGVREFPTQYFVSGIDRGRTLTHELGHYFELWHTWGDDGGACPGTGGWDDFIADTPPEGDAHYCSSGVCPTFPKTDNCSPSSPGVMFMNFMDYVDDRAMQMFTVEQGQMMRRMIMLDSESYSLTQHPELLLQAGISPAISESAFRVFPNPASDMVHIALTGGEKLLSIDILNMMGQSISHTVAGDKNDYTVPLGDAAPGIYFVQCHFAEGTLTKKIVLQ
jgi:hypothetical protein